MPKNIEDMVVPERRRSIRNIPIPEGRRKKDHESPIAPRENLDIPREVERSSTPTRRSKKKVWLAAVAAILLLAFAILSIFNGATLSYVPKSEHLSFNQVPFTARKSGETGLLYSVIKLSGDKGLEVPASGEEKVSRKASGTIVVYNNATTEAQRLVENTRFETPNGLIYRIPNIVLIPGKKVLSGTTTQPGMIEVTVFADEAGEKYNIGLNDFTLPGLKGSARYATIYGRSKTPMSGGFVGTEKVVSNDDRTRVKTELETALRDELISAARAQAPEGFVLLPSLSSVTFEDLPQTKSANTSNTTLNMRANLFGVMFKSSDLSGSLAGKTITLAPSESVDLFPLDSLNFAFLGASPPDLLLSEEIKFTVEGVTTAVWRTDEVALKSDLVGKHKGDISTILKNYPTVVSVSANIRPFWISTLPKDSSRIKLIKLPVQ